MLPIYPSVYHQCLHPDSRNHRSVTYGVVWAFLRNEYGACNDPTNPATNETGSRADGPLRVRHDIVGLKSQNTWNTKL